MILSIHTLSYFTWKVPGQSFSVPVSLVIRSGSYKFSYKRFRKPWWISWTILSVSCSLDDHIDGFPDLITFGRIIFTIFTAFSTFLARGLPVWKGRGKGLTSGGVWKMSKSHWPTEEFAFVNFLIEHLHKRGAQSRCKNHWPYLYRRRTMRLKYFSVYQYKHGKTRQIYYDALLISFWIFFVLSSWKVSILSEETHPPSVKPVSPVCSARLSSITTGRPLNFFKLSFTCCNPRVINTGHNQ